MNINKSFSAFMASSVLIFATTSASLADVNQCLTDMAAELKDVVALQEDSSIDQNTRNWFCSDEQFSKIIESSSDSNLCLLMDEDSLCFDKDSSNYESMQRRTQYCEDNQMQMESRESYALIRSVLTQGAKEILDLCVKGNDLGLTPLTVKLTPLDKTTVSLNITAKPLAFGETAPVLTELSSNMSCGKVPSGGQPLSTKGVEYVCKHSLGSCEIGWALAKVSAGSAADAQTQIPNEGSLGSVKVVYDVAVPNWVETGKRTVSGQTSGGNLNCDDDGSYEGGTATGNLGFSSENGNRIKSVTNTWCEGGAHWTCSIGTPYANSATSWAASIAHHSCGGSPTFKIEYIEEKLEEKLETRESDPSGLIVGGQTAFSLPGDAKNVRVVVTDDAGQNKILDGIDKYGIYVQRQSLRAERTQTGVLVSANNSCQ